MRGTPTAGILSLLLLLLYCRRAVAQESTDTCLSAVCSSDPVCCNATTWDSVCMGQIESQCRSLGPATNNNNNDVMDDVASALTSRNTLGENSCFKARNQTGGCSWSACSSTVCQADPSCCNTEQGGWTLQCVRRARKLCATLDPHLEDIVDDSILPVIYARDPYSPCPMGFICQGSQMANCSHVRQAAIDVYEVGDIYAGIYCPYGDDSFINCPAGSFCPDPNTMEPCPKGFYCPHKSIEPDLYACEYCEEGATINERDAYGYVVLFALLVPTGYFIISVLVRRYNKHLYDQLLDLQQRQTDSFNIMKRRRERNEQLERIRPKLDLIARRLDRLAQQHAHSDGGRDSDDGTLGTGETGGAMGVAKRLTQTLKPTVASFLPRTSRHGGRSSSHQNVILVTDHDIRFNAAGVFDAIDADGSGDVDFSELNAVLELNPVELSEFVRRMNDLAGDDAQQTSVTRPCFVKYFLQVLEETSRLTVSREEAGELFDEIAAAHGTNRAGEIAEDSLFKSSLADFLSDVQIHYIVKKFRKIASYAGRSRPGSGRLSSMQSTRNFTAAPSGKNSISKEEFMDHYPKLLIKATIDDVSNLAASDDMQMATARSKGVDITFEDLSLTVSLADNEVNVVDKVTGRLKASTMTALMGGSGAGKTSLLNALCGRAYYGEVRGKIFVNGHLTSIDQHKEAIGFVPQDDIVYAELTVRENLVYSGKFRLPRQTPLSEIEDLADETMANLGLSRIANSLVGDVRRRGVSGGEKKRVNIGLELMARPAAIFLDEPTSGLDASSALLVMKSLKHLVEQQGVTVCSVIHQPRKFIYDLFDSLVLLGVGGRMVYHGPTEKAREYFEGLRYKLPQGESMADWLIDISSGRLAPEVAAKRRKPRRAEPFRGVDRTASMETVESDNPDTTRSPTAYRRVARRRDDVDDDHIQRGVNRTTSLDTVDYRLDHATNEKRAISLMDSFAEEGESEIGRTASMDTSYSFESDDLLSSMESLPSHDKDDGPDDDHDTHLDSMGGEGTKDADVIGSKGVSTGKVDKAFEEARARREWLYQQWNSHFSSLNDDEKKVYDVPLKFEPPEPTQKPSFFRQLRYQVARAFLVGWRNRFSKLIDAGVIVGAVFFISLFAGVAEVTTDSQPEIKFDEIVRPNYVVQLFPELFNFSLNPSYLQYGLQVGVITGVLLGLLSSKIVTEKRIEFFREAGSGYDVNAYYIAINFVSTMEHAFQVFIASFFAFWLRDSYATAQSFFAHFLVLCWLCVSWGLVVSLMVPPENVVLVVGFYMSFAGFLFSGATAPIEYPVMYEKGGFMEVLAGFLSPTRYFIEAISVGEQRCFPTQTGFTVDETAVNFPLQYSSFGLLGLAMNDLGDATQQSCQGWYGTVVAAVLVGLTIRLAGAGAIHVFGRAKQIKKPIWTEIRRNPLICIYSALYLAVLVAMIFITSGFILRTTS